MSKPALLYVDDEPEVLRAVDRDLRDRYRSQYRIIRAGSGAEALEDFQHSPGTDPAERTLPARLFAGELKKVARDVDHAVSII